MSSSESIEASAATIDQAIGQALAQLGAEQDDVTIEVLSTPRSGVLGLGARQARVRVTRRAPAGARSGVMSPPPAPPLRATPPEMRRPEAAPEAHVEAPRPRIEPSAPTGDTRREAPGQSRREPRIEDRERMRDQREFSHDQGDSAAPRDTVDSAPPGRPERSDSANQGRSDGPRAERSDPRRQSRGGPPRRGRNELPREEPRGQSQTPSDAPPREERRERSDIQGRDRGEGQTIGRSDNQGQVRYEAQDLRDNRRAPARSAPRPSAPESRGNAARDERDERDDRNARDDRRDNGRSEDAPRPSRGRAGGPPGTSPGGAAASSTGNSAGALAEGRGRGGRRPGDPPQNRGTQPRDHELESDDERDPFASVDEAGNDPRKIADLQEQAREATIFLERILDLMGEQAVIEPAETDDPETLELNIKGDGSGILIGRHGQTLDAIEYMVNRLLARKIKDAAPISIDTESYRARRRRLLQRMALSKGEQAKREHIAVTLDPMPPRDRRIVHLALKDDPMIATRSTGEGFLRAIEILPVDERRDPNERGNDRGRGRTRARDQDKEPIGEQGGFKHGQKRIV
jgi:spoIIIJ-associated protein